MTRAYTHSIHYLYKPSVVGVQLRERQTMTLIKCSQRSTKCKRCGHGRGAESHLKLYWFHDDESPNKSNNYCTKHESYNFVMYTDRMERHKYNYNAGQCENISGTGNVTPVTNVWEMARDAGDGGRDEGWPTPTHDPAPPTHERNHDVGLVHTKQVQEMMDRVSSLEAIHDNDMVALQESMKTLKEQLRDEIERSSGPTHIIVNDKLTNTEYAYPPSTHHTMPLVLKWLEAGDNVWLVGPAGTGKSTIARQCAEILGREFRFESLSPDTFTTALTGYMDANGNYVSTAFREAYENGYAFLLDEVDNGHPSVLAKFNMALENGQMAFPDGIVKKHPDFLCMAAANTYGTGPNREYVGRMQIDAATLDRFTKVFIGIDEALELEQTMAQGADLNDAARLLSLVRHVRSKADEYNLPLVFSPRAAIKGARALAHGIPFDDVVAGRVKGSTSDTDWNKVSAGWEDWT